MQNLAAQRKKRFEAIRCSLKQNPIIKTNTIAVENKIEKRRKRRESVQLDETLTQSQREVMLEQDDTSVKGPKKFDQKYTLGAKIGQGSDGFVKKCYSKITNEIFAVKSMKMDDEHMIFLKKNFKDISALDHPNIIKYRNMYLDLKNSSCNLVMDYENNPNLLEHKNLEVEQIKIIMQQLLDTVAYIHSQKICHRDIKPQNILYDRQKKLIKLVDFGISKKFDTRGHKNEMLTITGTLFYQAPEIFVGGGYDEKVDVWAVGITFYQLVTGKTPFQSQFSGDTIKNIERGVYELDEAVWQKYGKAAKDLVARLLKNRSERFTALQAKKHFWFNKRPSFPIDLSKSDSLNFKIGEGLSHLTNKEYAQDSDKSRSIKNITDVKIDLKRKLICASSDSDSLIQIESQNEDEVESPSRSPEIMKQKQESVEKPSLMELKLVEREEINSAECQ